MDVEWIMEMEFPAMIAGRFFFPGESGKLRGVTGSAIGGLAFFNCRTQKEALNNAIGEGLSHPLNTFEVTFLPKEIVELRLDETRRHR